MHVTAENSVTSHHGLYRFVRMLFGLKYSTRHLMKSTERYPFFAEEAVRFLTQTVLSSFEKPWNKTSATFTVT